MKKWVSGLVRHKLLALTYEEFRAIFIIWYYNIWHDKDWLIDWENSEMCVHHCHQSFVMTSEWEREVRKERSSESGAAISWPLSISRPLFTTRSFFLGWCLFKQNSYVGTFIYIILVICVCRSISITLFVSYTTCNQISALLFNMLFSDRWGFSPTSSWLRSYASL